MRDQPLRQRLMASLLPALATMRLVVTDRRPRVVILLVVSTLLWLPSLAIIPSPRGRGDAWRRLRLLL